MTHWLPSQSKEKCRGYGSTHLCMFSHTISLILITLPMPGVNRAYTSYREGRGNREVKGLAQAHTARWWQTWD